MVFLFFSKFRQLNINVISFACLILACSCAGQRGSEQEELKFTRKTVNYRFNEKWISPNTPLYASRYVDLKDSTHLIYFDEKRRNFHITNLDDPSRLPITYELADSVFEFAKKGKIIAAHLTDSMLSFFQPRRFGIYDLSAREMKFSKRTEGTDSLPIFFRHAELPITYFHDKNEVYLEAVDFRNPEEKEYAFDAKFHYRLSLESDEWDFVPLKFPRSWGNGELGLAQFVNCAFKGDSMIYNFSNEDSIVLFSKTNGSLAFFDARSKFDKEMVKLTEEELKDFDKKNEHFNTSFLYKTIIYDKWKDWYYRVYAKDQPLMNEDGFFNTASDRTYGVIVLDGDFKKLGEITIPDKKAHTFGASRAGLIYIIPDTLNDNYFTYAALDIKK